MGFAELGNFPWFIWVSQTLDRSLEVQGSTDNPVKPRNQSQGETSLHLRGLALVIP